MSGRDYSKRHFVWFPGWIAFYVVMMINMFWHVINWHSSSPSCTHSALFVSAMCSFFSSSPEIGLYNSTIVKLFGWHNVNIWCAHKATTKKLRMQRFKSAETIWHFHKATTNMPEYIWLRFHLCIKLNALFFSYDITYSFCVLFHRFYYFSCIYAWRMWIWIVRKS